MLINYHLALEKEIPQKISLEPSRTTIRIEKDINDLSQFSTFWGQGCIYYYCGSSLEPSWIYDLLRGNSSSFSKDKRESIFYVHVKVQTRRPRGSLVFCSFSLLLLFPSENFSSVFRKDQEKNKRLSVLENGITVEVREKTFNFWSLEDSGKIDGFQTPRHLPRKEWWSWCNFDSISAEEDYIGQQQRIQKRKQHLFYSLVVSSQQFQKSKLCQEAASKGKQASAEKLHKYWLCPPFFSALARVLLPHIMWLLSPKNCPTYKLSDKICITKLEEDLWQKKSMAYLSISQVTRIVGAHWNGRWSRCVFAPIVHQLVIGIYFTVVTSQICWK